MNQLLLIGLGGAIGAVSRHLFGQWTLRVIGPEWPYGTFGVNVIGGLVMGLFIGWLAGAGRVTTITTEAVALASGGNRRVIGVYAFLQMLLPAFGFLVATAVPALLFRHRRAMRV